MKENNRTTNEKTKLKGDLLDSTQELHSQKAKGSSDKLEPSSDLNKQQTKQEGAHLSGNVQMSVNLPSQSQVVGNMALGGREQERGMGGVQNTGGSQTEQNIIVAPDVKPKQNYNYLVVNSRCRISMKQYKKEFALLEPTNSHPNVPILQYGLMELANENYTDLKNFFSSKTNKLLICITMGNDEIIELKKTLNGILDNLNYLNKKVQLSIFDITVIVVADGIANLNSEFKQKLFSSEIITKDPFPRPIEQPLDYMHCFRMIFHDPEYIPQNAGPSGAFKKLDFLLAVKERNSGTINSHMCFFNGFCSDYASLESKDKVNVLLTTTGTVLDQKALMKCYSTIETFPETMAVTGQIELNCENHSVLSWVAGQSLDYKLNHMFERQLENMLGYVNSLNLDFSFFKLKSIMTTEFTESYFKNSDFSDKYSNPFDKIIKDNTAKYLSSKFFLCEKSVNTIKLVPDAIAKVNPASEFVPKANLPDLEKTTDFASYLHNRRLQYNSKLMSTLNFMSDFCNIWKTQHTGIQKLNFCTLAIYHLLTQGMDYLMLSFNYIFIHVILSQTFYYKIETTSWLMWCYLILISIFIILSLAHNNVRHFETVYFILICFLFSFYIFVVGCWGYSMFYLSKNSENLYNDITNFNISPSMFSSSDSDPKFLNIYYRIDRPVIIGVAIINILGYLIPVILSLTANVMNTMKPFYFGILSYLFTLPTFGGMQQIFSLSNCDDYHLDTVNLSREEENTRTAEYRKFKVINILIYLALNGAFIFIFANTAPNIQTKISIIAGMVYFFTFFFLFKAMLAAGDMLRFLCQKKERHLAAEKLVAQFKEKSKANVISCVDLDNMDMNVHANVELQPKIQAASDSGQNAIFDKANQNKSPLEVKMIGDYDNRPKSGNAIGKSGSLTVDFGSTKKSEGKATKEATNSNNNINFMIDQNSLDILDREEDERNHRLNESLPSLNQEGRVSKQDKRSIDIDVNADIKFEEYESEGHGILHSKGNERFVDSNISVKNPSKSAINLNYDTNSHLEEVVDNDDEFEHQNKSIENFPIEVNEDGQVNHSVNNELHNNSNWDSPAKKPNTLDELTDKVKMSGANMNFDLNAKAKVDINAKAKVDIKASGSFLAHSQKGDSSKNVQGSGNQHTEEEGAKYTIGDVEGVENNQDNIMNTDKDKKVINKMEKSKNSF